MADAPAQIRPGALWTRAEVTDPSRWTSVLRQPEADDLLALVRALSGRSITSLSAADLPVAGPLADAARTWRGALRDGLGFVLVRGFPVDALSAAEIEIGYARSASTSAHRCRRT